MSDEEETTESVKYWVVRIGLAVLVLFVVLMWGLPQWTVYNQRLEGEAKLAEAESSRRVAVLEAQAKLDSADKLSEAEVKRAEGVAKANKIIGDSLHGNEGYLRYLWIQSISDAEKKGAAQVIYVPTEANLPILEATRSAPPIAAESKP